MERGSVYSNWSHVAVNAMSLSITTQSQPAWQTALVMQSRRFAVEMTLLNLCCWKGRDCWVSVLNVVFTINKNWPITVLAISMWGLRSYAVTTTVTQNKEETMPFQMRLLSASMLSSLALLRLPSASLIGHVRLNSHSKEKSPSLHCHSDALFHHNVFTKRLLAFPLEAQK